VIYRFYGDTHRITGLKFVPIYERNDPPEELQLSAKVEFALNMNDPSMRLLLDSLTDNFRAELHRTK
jgi:hypothetical protein